MNPYGEFGDQIVHVEEIASRLATFAPIPARLDPHIFETLQAKGIEQLYAHQAQACEAALDGKDVMIVTGTNSGKTLCYALPTLHQCIQEPMARALYVFPTKALAQDQLKRMSDLLPEGIRAGTYDGDTAASQRGSIRKLAHIILSNPDMLHVGVLPNHENWVTFLKNLRYIVIDEMHTYRGVFGSHVANVLRRLLRLCEWHRNRPQIIACSATIANPLSAFRRLTSREPVLIDEDASPQGRRTFIFWNPPPLKDAERASANVTSAHIVSDLVERGFTSLAFCRARISTELVLVQARKDLGDKANLVESYRGGYTPKERRQIEKAVRTGKLKGLIATNAMELGVDIGDLDAVVMNGYPGSISSFWQQAGRAGRGSKDGLAIMVAHDDPLEQFLLREPSLLFDKPVESVTINNENPQILSRQLLCAAHERPLSPAELSNFGDSAIGIAEDMDRSGELSYRAGLFYYPAFSPPAPGVNIRGASGSEIVLMCEGEQLGTMERNRALQNAHTGAIYLHRGQSYFVRSLDLDQGIATVIPTDANYYTQPVTQATVEELSRLERSGPFSLVGLKVTDQVIAYRKKLHDGNRVFDIVDLDLPPQTFETLAIRLDLPELPFDDDDPSAAISSVHGLEHALIAVAPLLAGCDRNDLGSAWYGVSPDTLQPAVFVFDRVPGGVGLTERLFQMLDAWLASAVDLLTSCPCKEGCPACLMSSRCEAANEYLSKKGTIELLRSVTS
ncbi:MAG: DEAD/DEAH box helicase [Fimbriimonadaceae bacterium]